MTNLLALTRAATEQRGTTRVIDGIEVAHTMRGPVVSVAIACTDSIRDLRRSLRASPVRFLCSYAHAGYLDAAKLVHEHLRPIVRRGGRLRLAGHSFGGAVARIVAELFHGQGNEILWLETYGEPKNLSNPTAFPGRRYVCGSDPVPRWPISRHYRHTTEQTQLKSLYPCFPGRGFLDHRLSSYEAATPMESSEE